MGHYYHILVLLFIIVLISSISVPTETFIDRKRYKGEDKVSCLHGSDKEMCDLYTSLNQTGSQLLADSEMDGNIDESDLNVPEN